MIVTDTAGSSWWSGTGFTSGDSCRSCIRRLSSITKRVERRAGIGKRARRVQIGWIGEPLLGMATLQLLQLIAHPLAPREKTCASEWLDNIDKYQQKISKSERRNTNLHFKREGEICVESVCRYRRKRVVNLSDLSYVEPSYLPAPPERVEQSRFGNQNTKDPGHGSC